MRIIQPGYEILTPLNGDQILKHIETCGRVCYKSESKITSDSCVNFVRALIKRGHEAVIEHYGFTVKFICDRGVSHEIVRHRIASFCQESTRYCNYAKSDFSSEITVIKPLFFDEGMDAYNYWKTACEAAEMEYFALLDNGCSPQQARSVLPNSLKTEIIMTANLREWRHFFKLRTAPAAHPQMREVAIALLKKLKQIIPVIFEDIEVA